MAEIMLGRTGLTVCRMGFGGIPIQRLKPEESDLVLERAIDKGINLFDSARIYTDSETKLGRVLPRHRARVVIATKTISRDQQGAARDIDRALAELHTDYIDIYQFHNIASEADLQKVVGPGGALAALVKAQEQGKIGHIGLSGHKPRVVLQALHEFPFATIQIPFNHMETEALGQLIPCARENQIGIIAMKPMGGGNIREIAANFRFIFHSGIDVAIPGMDAEAQVDENVSFLEHIGPPGAEEMKRLETEKARLGDHFCRRCEYCLPCPQGLPIAFLHVLKNYYFLYDLKDWVWDRVQQLAKSFKDCAGCRQCVEKCPYSLPTPEIFQRTWDAILADRGQAPALHSEKPGI